jgi:hypothetical protein
VTPEERAKQADQALWTACECGTPDQEKWECTPCAVKVTTDAIRAAVEEEREACAKLAETLPLGHHELAPGYAAPHFDDNGMIAAAIRARGQQ